MAVQDLILNGKFLSAAPTGVHRVAAELARALAGLIAAGHPGTEGLRLSALVPEDGMKRASALPFAVRQLGPLRSIPWEQITLPLRKGRGTLLNLCNIGPVLSRDAVTMIHDTQVLLTPESYRPAFLMWYRTVQPLIGMRHRHLLTVSAFSRGQIVAAGLCPPERVSVVHNGADHILRERSDPAVFEKLGLTNQGYVLALASTLAYKNIALLLRAFHRPELEGLKLVLFGSSGMADFEAKGIKVPPSTVFAGRIDDGALRHLMENALALAFPSTTEGFGLPPLEAMHLGCPVVAAPCGALPEVCGDAAVYAGPDDPVAWAAALVEMRRNPAWRQRHVDAGLEQAQQFTWDKAAATLVEILSRI